MSTGAIVAELIEAAATGGPVVYAVPGSPNVAERTVVLLAEHPRVASGEVALVVHPSVSFLDIAFARLGVDPVDAGVRLVDAERFAVEAAGERGPLLVAQCWSRQVLSEVKLSVESTPDEPVTVLHHLGLPDETVVEVPWDDLDRSFEPDHLTSVWIPQLAAPVAAELVALDELVRTLRERCPWDRRQTHASLGRHLLEESYEVLEAIDALSSVDGGTDVPMARDHVPGDHEATAVAHLEEELGDLLFQVYFHATLAAEEGRFTLADVARGVHDKLVSRHPHVFGDVDRRDGGRRGRQLGGHQEGGKRAVQRDRGDPGGTARPGAGGQTPTQGRRHRDGPAGVGRRGDPGGRRRGPAGRRRRGTRQQA